jgi:cytochrome d ubiquinol oxidase subunit I
MPDLTPLVADASSNLLAARNQMGMTLGFHIVLACFGVAFPALMLIAEYRGLRYGDLRSVGPRRWRCCSPSERSAAPCSRSSSACYGRG